jgi:hypothetical protein
LCRYSALSSAARCSRPDVTELLLEGGEPWVDIRQLCAPGGALHALTLAADAASDAAAGAGDAEAGVGAGAGGAGAGAVAGAVAEVGLYKLNPVAP